MKKCILHHKENCCTVFKRACRYDSINYIKYLNILFLGVKLDSFKRQVARKVRIKDLLDGRYIKVDGEWEPNYIQAANGSTFSRVNIISVVASEPVQDANFNSFVIDDGTGRVAVRVFGGESKSIDVQLGDIILLIGRPREFGQQVYIAPEIIKKISDNRWIEYRKLELRQHEQVENIIAEKTSIPETEHIEDEAAAPDIVDKAAQSTIIETENAGARAAEKNPIDKIIDVIRDLDKGEGADTEEVISASATQDAEKIIDNLLKEGEIFEVRSGRIKLLE